MTSKEVMLGGNSGFEGAAFEDNHPVMEFHRASPYS